MAGSPAGDACSRRAHAIEQFPESFGPTQLRTLQRFMKAQRVAAAQKLLEELIGEAPAPAAIRGASDTEWPDNILT